MDTLKKADRQIRVYDLFISVCQRWRSLIICFIAGALILGAYGWWTSAKVNEAEVPKADKETAWHDVLNYSDKNDVDRLYESIIQYEQMVTDLGYITDELLKAETMEHISAAQNNISTVKARFTEDQLAYLDYLMGDEDIVPGDKTTYEHKSNVETSQERDGKRHIRKKFIVLGAFVGLVLAIIVIVLKYILTGTLKTEGEACDNFGLNILGRVEGDSRFYRRRKTRLDKWLKKKKHKQEGSLSYEERIELAAMQIKLAAGKRGSEKLCVIADRNVDIKSQEGNAYLEDIARKSQLDISILCNVLERTDMLESMSESDAAVIAFQTEKSKYNDIYEECALCKKYGLDVLGAIVVE